MMRSSRRRGVRWEGAAGQTAPSRRQPGFTLIELMIVVAIIGILAAIAIPQYSSFRIHAFNAVAERDLRNLMTNEEAYYTEHQLYFGPVSSDSGQPGAVSGLPGSLISRGVGYSIVAPASAREYAVYTGHDKGNAVYSGSDAGLMRVNKFSGGTNPRVSAASEGGALTSAWGTGPL